MMVGNPKLQDLVRIMGEGFIPRSLRERIGQQDDTEMAEIVRCWGLEGFVGCCALFRVQSSVEGTTRL